jgi:amidophosphoribosyltransferase
MGSYEELIAHTRTVDEIKVHVGADSLYFLSLEGMMSAIGRAEGYCNACFTGRYPLHVNLDLTKSEFEPQNPENEE